MCIYTCILHVDTLFTWSPKKGFGFGEIPVRSTVGVDMLMPKLWWVGFLFEIIKETTPSNPPQTKSSPACPNTGKQNVPKWLNHTKKPCSTITTKKVQHLLALAATMVWCIIFQSPTKIFLPPLQKPWPTHPFTLQHHLHNKSLDPLAKHVSLHSATACAKDAQWDRWQPPRGYLNKGNVATLMALIFECWEFIMTLPCLNIKKCNFTAMCMLCMHQYGIADEYEKSLWISMSVLELQSCQVWLQAETLQFSKKTVAFVKRTCVVSDPPTKSGNRVIFAQIPLLRYLEIIRDCFHCTSFGKASVGPLSHPNRNLGCFLDDWFPPAGII